MIRVKSGAAAAMRVIIPGEPTAFPSPLWGGARGGGSRRCLDRAGSRKTAVGPWGRRVVRCLQTILARTIAAAAARAPTPGPSPQGGGERCGAVSRRDWAIDIFRATWNADVVSQVAEAQMKASHSPTPIQRARARALRRAQTEPERRLWYALRYRLPPRSQPLSPTGAHQPLRRRLLLPSSKARRRGRRQPARYGNGSRAGRISHIRHRSRRLSRSPVLQPRRLARAGQRARHDPRRFRGARATEVALRRMRWHLDGLDHADSVPLPLVGRRQGWEFSPPAGPKRFASHPLLRVLRCVSDLHRSGSGENPHPWPLPTRGRGTRWHDRANRRTGARARNETCHDHLCSGFSSCGSTVPLRLCICRVSASSSAEIVAPTTMSVRTSACTTGSTAGVPGGWS